MKNIWILIILLVVTPLLVAQDQPFDEEEPVPMEDDIGSPDDSAPPIPPPPPRRSDFGGTPGGSGGANPAFDSVKKRNRNMKFADANPEDITDENFPELIDSFDFPNADIADVIKAISELTGKNFIIDPGVRGKITIIAPTRVTVAEAYKAFLSALAINNFTVVPSGKFLKIKQSRVAQTDTDIFTGAYTPNSDQMITKIIQLKFIQAADVNKFFRTLNSKDGNLIVYEPTNTVIISDYGSNIARIQKIIEQVDVSSFDEQLEVIPVRFAKAKDISALIDQIVNKGSNSKGTGTFRSNIPRFRRQGTESSASNATYFVIPDDRTNTLVVVGNKPGIAKIKKLVAQLDFEIRPEDAGGIYVYYVRHGEAKSIADTLNGLAKQSTAKTTPGAGGGSSAPIPPPGGSEPTSNTRSGSSFGDGAIFGGEVKMVADESTNSLVVNASRQDYEVVLNLLGKIDIPRDQVYVEAIIMEMEVTDNLNYGITLLNLDKGSKGVGRVGFSGGNLASLLNVAGTNGAVLGFAQGETVEVDVNGTTVEVKSLLGFIDFLKTVVNTNILSTPQILALDNEESTIEVGDRVPIARNTESGTDGTSRNNIQFDDATIKLTLTPYISPDRETVRMKVDQQIKQVANRVAAAANLSADAISLSTRTVKSNVVVRNGDTIVIGGLMRDQESPTVRKVPLLGDIPILGWLFKSTNIRVEKQNLLVFMTPKIIRTKSDALKLSDQKIKERLQFVKDNFGGKDAHGRVIESIRKANLRNPAAADLIEEE